MLVFELDNVLIDAYRKRNKSLIDMILAPAIKLRNNRQIDAIILLTNNNDNEYILRYVNKIASYLKGRVSSPQAIFDYIMTPSNKIHSNHSSQDKTIVDITYILEHLKNKGIPYKSDQQILDATYLFDSNETTLSRQLPVGHFFKVNLVHSTITNGNTLTPGYADMTEYESILEELERASTITPREKTSIYKVLGGTRKKTRKHKTKKRRAY